MEEFKDKKKMDDLPFQSAVNLVKAIQEKKISSSELLELYIERYERYNPSINAIVETDFETARAKARQADEALANNENWGPLHGLPMTIKDYINVTGLHTTYGSPIFKDNLPTTNSDVVQPLIDAGAIIFGKTNLPLWAMGTQSFNEVYGQTNNPWDLTRTSGGSSGGSAAAIAAGLSGLEIGSDHAGSIRSPAHFCGIYGHKPTYGIVPIHGQQPPKKIELIDYSPEQDFTVTGPLARSAADLDLVMDLAVRPPVFQRKAIKINLPTPRKKALKDYRIGVWIEDPLYSPDTEVGECLERLVVDLLKKGTKIDEKKPDFNFHRSVDVFYELMQLANVAYMSEEEFNSLRKKSNELDTGDQSIDAWYARVLTKTHREWQLLNYERLMIRQKWADYFKKYDVLLCPAVRIAAFPHDHSMGIGSLQRISTKFGNQDVTHGNVMTPWATLASLSYLPASIAPIGLTSDGLPAGVQIIGPYLEDRTTIHFAKLIEENYFGFQPPPGF
ncbi:MAG: amidase [Deltaproteobacteria bacterium]|nr:amidase [Deltaproteobacteria bacterium]